MLERLLKLPLDRGPLLVLTHDNPDPDSIASAAAMQYLLRRLRDVESTVAYSGIVGRAENRAMLELLTLPIRPLSATDLDQFAHVALVDAQPDTGNNALPAGRIPDIVVDHHPLREATTRSPFYDVRPELGAAATLLTDYLQEADIPIPRDLATALLYGIRSETQDLGREVDAADRIAYQHLFPLADAQILSAIARPRLPRSYFDQMSVALQSLQVLGSSSVCPLNVVIDPDFVPEIADLAVRMEGIQWSLAYGSFDQKLYVSIRTNDPDADAGALMQRILEGLGRGGGHGMRAGGNVDLSRLKTPRVAVENEIRKRFLDETGTENR